MKRIPRIFSFLVSSFLTVSMIISPITAIAASEPVLVNSNIKLPGMSIASYGEFLSFSICRETWGGRNDIVGWDTVNRMERSNWNATPDVASYYIDESGNLCVVIAEFQPVYEMKSWNVSDANGTHTEEGEVPEMTYMQKVWIYRYNRNFEMIDKKELGTPEGFNIWGGFHVGSDNHFYIAVGRGNPEASETKTVIKILRYDRNWNHVGTANISGKQRSSGGIAWPFNAGNCSMLVDDGVLYIHTSRIMAFDQYAGHQANITYCFDTETMNEISDFSGVSYVSHSFQQLLASDGEYIYFLDHGDAYPRSIRLSIYSKALKSKTLDLFDFMGVEGNNYTGATVGAMEAGKDCVLIAGSSEPHYNAVQGKTGFGSDFMRNIYLITVSDGGSSSQFRWITNFDPNGNTSVESPRMVKINDDCFVLLYNIVEENNWNETRTLECVALDGSGNEINRTSYKDVYFADSSNPIYYDGDIVWIQPQKPDLRFFIHISAKNEPLPVAPNYFYRLSYLKAAGLEPPFDDVNRNDWFYETVGNVYKEGLMVGTSDTTFEPNGNVTIAEAITMASRAHAAYTGNVIKNTSKTFWYDSYVDYAIENDIVNHGDFPDYGVPATRAEMAYIFSNIIPDNKQTVTNNKTPPDVRESDKYGKEIYLLYRLGILKGNDSIGSFSPNNNITRAEAAAIILRVHNLLRE
ncbi:MAG: S-layer homology domain-containing protein [Hungateiclostridium thermocellum]|nr:S-layer homology domain-containing protein [Acetivibrio thermocellus]